MSCAFRIDFGAAASAQLNSSYRSGRLWAQLGWVAHFDACAMRHEYELDREGRPVIPTDDEIDRSIELDMAADHLFAKASAKGVEGGTDAAFGYLADEL